MGPFCVIVNYRTAELTLRSLEALLAALDDLPDARVLIVDNDSRDGSYEVLCQAVRQRGLAPRVEVVASPKNGGFGYGCNIGIRRNAAAPQPADYVYILNSFADIYRFTVGGAPLPDALQRVRSRPAVGRRHATSRALANATAA